MAKGELDIPLPSPTDEPPVNIVETPSPTPKTQQGGGNTRSVSRKTETIKVVPAQKFKFDKETREQLSEWFEWVFKGLDMGVDYGLGVDTSEIPIWSLNEGDADVFVRILERRAGRSDYIKDTVVPKMLESRDYIEAGLLLAPRFGATIQEVVAMGGPKPHIKKRSDEQSD